MMKFIVIMMMMMFTKNNKTSMTLIILMMNMSLQTSINSKMSYMFMGDLISFWITNMSLMVMFTLMFMKMKQMMFYFKIMTAMTLMIMMTFFNWNFVVFYILFEMSMITILVITITWGYQPERIEAMMFMIMMTLIFSLPFFLTMMINKESLNFWFMSINFNMLTYMSYMFVFMMKMPVYFVHFWLPKVHVEAPVHGSMMLAAIMLKLGCYGMMRMMPMMIKFKKMNIIIMSAAMWSVIILSSNSMMQTDMKTLIAYSSIVHMTMVFMNILIMKSKSMLSSMLVVVGHGLCSASMFFMSNEFYKKSKSRSMMLNKGMAATVLPMTFLWFIVCMNNAPMPPSMNMMGELISFKSMINWSEKMLVLIFIGAFLSSMYSIYLFYLPSHGKLSKNINFISSMSTKKTMIIIALISPIMLVMIKPSFLII